jgi:hypothetical protein
MMVHRDGFVFSGINLLAFVHICLSVPSTYYRSDITYISKCDKSDGSSITRWLEKNQETFACPYNY